MVRLVMTVVGEVSDKYVKTVTQSLSSFLTCFNIQTLQEHYSTFHRFFYLLSAPPHHPHLTICSTTHQPFVQPLTNHLFNHSPTICSTTHQPFVQPLTNHLFNQSPVIRSILYQSIFQPPPTNQPPPPPASLP